MSTTTSHTPPESIDHGLFGGFDPAELSATDLRQTCREERFKQALLASTDYQPITERFFHPTPTSSEANAIRQLSPERLIALIQHNFLCKNYSRIIRSSHTHIIHHHPSLLAQKQTINTEATKTLAIILESTLICFKKLFLHPDPQNPIHQSLLEQFLEWSHPFYQAVPSLGIPGASLLIKLNKPDDALKAITPALVYSGSPRIQEIIKEAMACSNDRRASALRLVQDLSREPNKTHLKSAIQHLGLLSFITDTTLLPSSLNPEISTSELESWSSGILLALQESDQSTPTS